MAVIKALPGLVATICVGGNSLREHEDTHGSRGTAFKVNGTEQRAAADKMTSNYVECVAGSEFSINLVFTDFELGDVGKRLTLHVYVDGKRMGVENFDKSILNDWNCIRDTFYRRISKTEVTRSKFKFCAIGKVDTADSEQVKLDAEKVRKTGLIVLVLHRTTFVDRSKPLDSQVNSGGSISNVSENALQGTASLQDASGQHFHDGYENPMGVFVFKYRSREELKSKSIIPRSMSPESAPRQLAVTLSGNQEDREAALKHATDHSKETCDDPKRMKRERDDTSLNGGRSAKKQHRDDASADPTSD